MQQTNPSSQQPPQHLQQMQQFLYRQAAQGVHSSAAGVGGYSSVATPSTGIPTLPQDQGGLGMNSSGFQEEDRVIQHILELTNPLTREQALLELSKKREAYENLAPILWHSFGTKWFLF